MLIEFLLEEPSMSDALRVILPQILPQNIKYYLRPHNGREDLRKSIPIKIRAYAKYKHEKVKFIILHDQHSHDCKKLKSELMEVCKNSGECDCLIRIVCTELESWYLGDLQAIEKAYPKFKSSKFINKEKFRNPDKLTNAAEEMIKILPSFQKGQGSKNIPVYMDLDNNKSESFKQFVSGVRKFLGIMSDLPLFK